MSTKELKVLLFTFGVIILLYSAVRDPYYTLNVQTQLPQLQQQQPQPISGVKITSPTKGQQYQ